MQEIHHRSTADDTGALLSRLAALAERLEIRFRDAADAATLLDLSSQLASRASEWRSNLAELQQFMDRFESTTAAPSDNERSGLASGWPEAGTDAGSLLAHCVRWEDAAAAAFQRVLETPDLALRLRFSLSRQLEATYTHRIRWRARAESSA